MRRHRSPSRQPRIVASISEATVWRWLSADAIRPWSHRSWRSWLFSREVRVAERAAPVLDPYQGLWQGGPLGADDYVICADEKTSIQARQRRNPGAGAGPQRPRRVEFEYQRQGAVVYLAAWDVHRAKLFGQCEARTGIDPFHRLVDRVMQRQPYRSARRVFWITDNGSSHRGNASVQRLAKWYPQAILVHTPLHARWLNQVDTYFSVVQRKLLLPNDFADVAALAD